MKIPKGNELQILKYLLRGPSYGQELIDKARIKEGAVYKTLHRMEVDKGYLIGWDEKVPGEAGVGRRYYGLTDDGRRALNAAEAAAREFARPLKPLKPKVAQA